MEKAKNNVIKITAILSSIIILTLVFLAIFEKRNIERANDGINQDMILTTTEISEKEYEAYGISEKAVKAVQVTATVTPAEAASICKLDWSVAWADGSSSGVNNYVRVTPSYDGALTATVTCLSYFDSAITLKATVREDTSIYATKTINCRARLTELEYVYLESDNLRYDLDSGVFELNLFGSSFYEYLEITNESLYDLIFYPYYEGHYSERINLTISISLRDVDYRFYMEFLDSICAVPYEEVYEKNSYTYDIFSTRLLQGGFIEAEDVDVIDMEAFLNLQYCDMESYDFDWELYKNLFRDFCMSELDFLFVITAQHVLSGDETLIEIPFRFNVII